MTESQWPYMAFWTLPGVPKPPSVNHLHNHSSRHFYETFEALPGVPKPPSINHLHNYGTLAFPKWLETKNPRKGANKKISGQQKEIWATKNFLGSSKMFVGTTI